MGGVRLRLDAERWREHLGVVSRATPGLVPVIKGNGYGFGRARLAEEAAELGVDTIAVGVAREVARVRRHFDGDVVILQPWDAGDDAAQACLADPKVITTVSRLADLDAIADSDLEPRVLVEVLTSMRRHGIRLDHLGAVTPLLQRVRFEGWSIHLPLRVEGRYAEAEALTRAAVAVIPGTLWLSHLPPDEASQLARRRGVPSRSAVRLRVGTRLWLGDETHRETVATVLDVHPVRRGERAGYRGGSCPADGWIVVVAGRHRARHRDGGADVRGHPAAAGGLGGDRISGGGGPGPQPVHDQREEALVPRAAAHAVEPAVPAPQGDAAGHRGRGARWSCG